MRTLVSISIGCFFAANIYAQSELPEFTKDPAKVYKKIYYDFPKEGRSSKSGGGYSVSMKLLKAPPKKVALVTFFTFDPGCTRDWKLTITTSNTGGNSVMTTSTTTYHHKELSSGGTAGPIVMGIYASTIDTLIKTFKSYGMELLVPEQYLDTKEKQEYYDQFEPSHGGLQHGFKAWLSEGSDVNDVYGYLKGYKVLDVVDEPQANYEKSKMLSTLGYKAKVYDRQIYLNNSDDKFMNSMGSDLASNLGVDAVLYVYITIYRPRDSKIVLQNLRMIMLGQNPVQLEEKDKKPFFYHKGVFYCGASISPETEILNIKKKEPETDKLNFTGFDILMVKMADKIGLYLTGKED